ncbi:unnamed protein product [Heligmosomoides polygyrus]|uniref:Endo/exonuclease/phosphatase domain-containing protein n=1 Tax=Heligmosomoides polygyrus TaxID=6339 RepID=A0A183G6I0_HELPZ|nr:unnamed protein product [Heligmosomoides polygyrus]
MTICTYNANTLASEAVVEDLMIQARKIKCDIIGLTETRRHHPLHAACDYGEELFLGTFDSRGVGGVGVLVNTHLAMSIDWYKSLTSHIGRLRLKQCGYMPALTVLVYLLQHPAATMKRSKVFTGPPSSGHECRRKNITSEPMVWSDASKVKGGLISSCQPKPSTGDRTTASFAQGSAFRVKERMP